MVTTSLSTKLPTGVPGQYSSYGDVSANAGDVEPSIKTPTSMAIPRVRDVAPTSANRATARERLTVTPYRGFTFGPKSDDEWVPTHPRTPTVTLHPTPFVSGTKLHTVAKCQSETSRAGTT